MIWALLTLFAGAAIGLGLLSRHDRARDAAPSPSSADDSGVVRAPLLTNSSPSDVPEPLPAPKRAARAVKGAASCLPKRAAFIDCETTGLEESDRIVTLAILSTPVCELHEGNVDINVKYEIYNPGKACHWRARQIHGFDDWTLKHQPKFAESASEIAEALTSVDLIVGHNVAFDLGFLRRELVLAGFEPPHIASYCTMAAHRSAVGGSASLERAAAFHGLAREGTIHGALEDAWLAMRIYLRQVHAGVGFPFDRLASLARPNNFREPPPKPRRPRRQRPADAAGAAGDLIRGKRFVLTGVLTAMSREVAITRVEALGGICLTSVNGLTDYLVVGADAGPAKLATAYALAENRKKPEILWEAEFLMLLASNDQ